MFKWIYKNLLFSKLLSIQRAVGTCGANGQNVQEPVDQEQTAESDFVLEIDVQEHTNKQKTAITPHVLVISITKVCIFRTGL